MIHMVMWILFGNLLRKIVKGFDSKVRVKYDFWTKHTMLIVPVKSFPATLGDHFTPFKNSEVLNEIVCTIKRRLALDISSIAVDV